MDTMIVKTRMLVLLSGALLWRPVSRIGTAPDNVSFE